MCLASKTCQYACNDIKIFVGLKEVSLKATQFKLQKKLHGLRNLTKGAMNLA